MKLGKLSVLVVLLALFSLAACSNGASVPDDGIIDDVEIEDGEDGPIFPFIGDDYEIDEGDGDETDKDGDEDKPVTCGKYESLDDNEMCVCDEGYERDGRERCLRKYVVGSVKISPNSIESALANEEYTTTFSAEPTNRARGRELSYTWSLEYDDSRPRELLFDGGEGSKSTLQGTSKMPGVFGFTVKACISVDGSDAEPVCSEKHYDLTFREDLVLNAEVVSADKSVMCEKECSTLQCKSFCSSGEQEERKIDVLRGGGDVVIQDGGELVVIAKAISKELEWSIESEGQNARLDEGTSLDKRKIVSSDGEDLENVIVKIKDALGIEAEIHFESIKFVDGAPRLVLGSKRERLMARHLLSAPVAYVEDGMQNEQLIECPGNNDVITGIAYKVGILNDGEHAYRCAKHMVGKKIGGAFNNLWPSCAPVIKEMTFVCKDINELDSKTPQWSNPLSDGLYPAAVDAPTQTFELSGAATSIAFTFGTITTPQVAGVGLAGASVDSRFEDNLLQEIKNPLIAWSGQQAYERGVARCDEGEVLTGIRAQTGWWHRSNSIFGASHIQCSKVSIASE